ncbi:hypothetical protein EVAR_34567_1 [Eumeta japonica]|uniref:Uncharacterized protein n=1 Tax=Eumeta variegata TaxID=151549 RepID=A0A4C1X8A0_EUMVA|nr:hypothetical protein EVAR_34567_1 [Eumeta japonica]
MAPGHSTTNGGRYDDNADTDSLTCDSSIGRYTLKAVGSDKLVVDITDNNFSSAVLEHLPYTRSFDAAHGGVERSCGWQRWLVWDATVVKSTVYYIVALCVRSTLIPFEVLISDVLCASIASMNPSIHLYGVRAPIPAHSFLIPKRPRPASRLMNNMQMAAV